MANLRLYFELLHKSLAISAQGPLGYSLPPIRQEDTLVLDISLIKQVSTLRAPLFELQNATAWSLRASVGTVASVLATTTSFTIDSTGTILSGSLALNTSGINALSDGTEVYFELIATLNGANYGRRFPVRVEKAVFLSGTLVTPADDTALGRAEGLRTFVAKEGAAGDGFIMQAENGVRAWIYLDNDGQLKAEPIA